MVSYLASLASNFLHCGQYHRRGGASCGVWNKLEQKGAKFLTTLGFWSSPSQLLAQCFVVCGQGGGRTTHFPHEL